MTRVQWIEANLAANRRVPKLGWFALALIVVGIAGFAWAAGDGMRAWQAFWVNFIYFAGLGQAGVILATIIQMARGRWGGALIRIGLLNIAYVVVTLLLFIVVLFGAGNLLPWVAYPVEAKAWWLNLNFFMIRNAAALAILTLLSLLFAYRVLRVDAGIIATGMKEGGSMPFLKLLTRGWKGEEVERAKTERILGWLPATLFLVFALVFSLLGFDMVMSLDPHWYSNLFGAYFMITSLYMGIAGVILVSVLLRKPMGLEEQLDSHRYHDIGKVLFAFCLLSVDFFWSQFLVIWYGDIPEEVSFIVHRIQHDPWVLLSYAVLFGGFVLPFVILINRRIKQIPWMIATIATLVLIGGFAERLLGILPSLNPEPGVPFPIGIPEFMVTLGFVGLYGGALLWAARRAPLIPLEVTESKADH